MGPRWAGRAPSTVANGCLPACLSACVARCWGRAGAEAEAGVGGPRRKRWCQERTGCDGRGLAGWRGADEPVRGELELERCEAVAERTVVFLALVCIGSPTNRHRSLLRPIVATFDLAYHVSPQQTVHSGLVRSRLSIIGNVQPLRVKMLTKPACRASSLGQGHPSPRSQASSWRTRPLSDPTSSESPTVYDTCCPSTTAASWAR